MKLKEKVAIITGAANGIGRGTALRFAHEGAFVVANDLSFMAAESISEKINGEFGKNRAIPVEADVTNIEDVKNLFNEAVSKFGRVDILVSNAGVRDDSSLDKMSEERWDRVIDVHLKGCFNCIMEAQKLMTKQQYGKIIIMSSPVPPLLRNPGRTNYDTASAGLAGLTASLAVDLGPYNINVNCIAPEFIQTQMSIDNAKRDGMYLDDFKKAVLSQIPLRRLGKPEDIGNVAVFLASDDSGYVSGQVLNVRGGP